jgi:hypothetical protein
LTGFLELLQASPLATGLRGSFIAYPLVNATHILAIGALVTCAALMDLRVLGLGSALPVKIVLGYLRPVAAVALLIAIATGALLFSVRPLEYADNPAFRLKLILVSAAIANAVVYNLLPGNSASGLRKILVITSLILWLMAAVAGRFIGFVQ